ncbi:MAG: hypothetical protein ACKVOE_09655 [Rickettsiales bacterium]
MTDDTFADGLPALAQVSQATKHSKKSPARQDFPAPTPQNPHYDISVKFLRTVWALGPPSAKGERLLVALVRVFTKPEHPLTAEAAFRLAFWLAPQLVLL